MNWTPKEIQYLKDNLVHWNFQEVAKDLKRSEKAVKSKANSIGIFKRKQVKGMVVDGVLGRIRGCFNGDIFESKEIKCKRDYVEFMETVYHSVKPALIRERKIQFEIELKS